MGKHFPFSYLDPISSALSGKTPHQCGVHIGLYTLSGRWGLHMGCCIMKGVSERCIARLLLTLQSRIYPSTEPVKPQNPTGKMQILPSPSANFIHFKDSGSVTAPSQMKENQSSEFQAFPTVHLTEPLYIVEK